MDEEVKKLVQEKMDELIQQVTALHKNVWNVKELAMFMSVTEGRVRRMASNGEITHYKSGKQLYFKREEIERWMTRTRRASKEEINQMAATYLCKKRMF